MPSYDPDFFNIDPYYDDFDENKKFLKFLFRPGYALQARELTQLQSVLQNQIERFGNFILDDGSMVFGGQITEIPAKIATLDGLTGIQVADIVDKTVSLHADGYSAFAKIIYGMKNPLTQEDVVYLQYLSGDDYDGEANFGLTGFNLGITFSASVSGGITSGLVVFVDSGIRYTNGYFVIHDSQRLGVYEVDEEESEISFNTPSSSVGFEVVKSIVTVQDDISLRDPASGFYNYNAPGSDRFKIDLLISQRALTASVSSSVVDPLERTDFIEFLRVVDGNVVKKEKYPDLGEIEETFARRTYDESGHYIVDPFELSMMTADDQNSLMSKLDSGKAYVFGYEFETMGYTTLKHDRARSTEHVRRNNNDVQYGYSTGPFILVKFSGISGGASGFSLSNSSQILFDSYTGYQTQTIGKLDGIKFDVGPNATTKDFTPGLTLYFADNPADLTGGEFNGASAFIQSKILRVNTNNTYTSEGYANIVSIEIGPPHVTGNNWTSGITSSYIDTTPFYVAAGASFEAGEEIVFTGSNPEIFQTIPALQFTGGDINTQIASARARNLQKLSGDIHKLFFDDLKLESGKSLSEMKRIFVDGNTGTPIFFAAEIPTQIYNPQNTSLVYESPYGEVVKTINGYEFMTNFVFEDENVGGGDPQIELDLDSIDGLIQIGPNIAGSSIYYDVDSSQIVSVYHKEGKVDCLIQIPEGTPDNPKVLNIKSMKVGGRNITAGEKVNIVVSCLMGGINDKRTKTKVTSSIGFTAGSFTGPDEQDYYYAYFRNGSSNLTDIYEIVSITGDVPNYVFDNGQKDTYYDFVRIKTKILYGGSGFTANVNHFTHSGLGPFVGGDNSSYPSYEEIPQYDTQRGRTVSLRNSLDFRPVRTGNETTFSLTGPYEVSSFIYDGFEHSVSYDYYLPRIDKIVLTKDKQFRVIQGVPNEEPVPPPDNPNAMTLYMIRFNPYTFDQNDVTIVNEDNRRFTMKDIGNLERRVEKLEYYSTLSLLEQEAKNTPIYDEFGFEIPKKAILVDQFTGTESSDVSNTDFLCSINKETKELRPPCSIFQMGYTEQKTPLLSGLTSSDNMVTFEYSTVEYISNKKTNSSRKINSNSIVDFNGTVRVIPHCDPWFSTNKSPMVKSNIEGENDSWSVGKASFSMNSNFWDHNWFGKNSFVNKVDRKKTTISKNYKTKQLAIDKIGTFGVIGSSIKSTPERIVDTTIVPYCREKDVDIYVSGLRPNKEHYIYFDTNPTPIASFTTSSNGSQLISNLIITGDTYLAGKKLVRVIDNNQNSLSTSTSSADVLFPVSGMAKDMDSSRFSRPLLKRREASNSPNMTNDTLTREFQRKEGKSKLSKENLAQIFTVDPSRTPLGIMVKSVGIYFSAWPTESPTVSSYDSFEKNLPVKLFLKPVVNGYPSPSKIIAESQLYDIENVSGTENSTDGYKYVEFEFDYPIYLEPSDYALELETNSSAYAVKTYILPSSENSLNLNERESVVDTYIGSFFLPKNTGKSEKINNEVLSFVINKCDFSEASTSGTITFQNIVTNNFAEFRGNISGSSIDPLYCSIDYNKILYVPNITNKVKTPSNSNTIEIDMKPINNDVSPAIDLEATNFVFAKYISASNDAGETEAKDIEALGQDIRRNPTKSRYITKTVNTLQPAKNISVVFDRNQPSETGISVYLKKSDPNSNTAFDDNEYIKLEKITKDNPISEDEFIKTEYRCPQDISEFTTFAVKVVFTSENNERYATIKNLRIAAI
jgi:hypothetical protein